MNKEKLIQSMQDIKVNDTQPHLCSFAGFSINSNCPYIYYDYCILFGSYLESSDYYDTPKNKPETKIYKEGFERCEDCMSVFEF
jgi:hypothetical protein